MSIAMSPTKLLALGAFGLLALSGSAFAAAAPICTTDADCAHGFTCQASTVVPTPQPARHDVDGGTGTVATGGVTGESGAGGSDVNGGTVDPTKGTGTGGAPASTTVTSTCQPAPGTCTTDSDCGAGLVCFSQTVETCSGSGSSPACPAGTKCDTSGAVTQSTCTSQTVSGCVYKWALPCNADADCGDGFVCQPSIGGVCSGGTPASGGAGGETGGGTTAPPLVADTCVTTMTYPGSCQPATPACAADADCPSSWVCQDVGGGVVSTGGSVGSAGAAGAGGASGTAPSAGDGVSAGGADVAATPNTKMCTAPSSGVPLSSKDGGGGVGGQTGTTTSSDPTAATGGTTGNGTTTPPERTDGSGGSAGSGGTTGGPTSAAGGASGAHDTSAPASTDSSGGCAVIATGTPTGAGAALAMLAGLALVARRRRR